MNFKVGDKVHVTTIDHPGTIKELTETSAGLEFDEYPGAVVWVMVSELQSLKPLKKPIAHGWLSVGPK